MTRAPEVLSAIDLGTNSFRMVAARADLEGGRFFPVLKDRETVRLGGDGDGDLRRLSPAAMRRGLRALRRFALESARLGARTRAVATSAVREAANGGAFVRRARRETGLRIEVISGAEEARLIYLGVLQALPVFDRKVLLVDIGGGSTELLLARRRSVAYAHSLKMGSIRFTRKFLDPDRLRPSDLRACREAAEGLLGPAAREVRRSRFDLAVGTAGTVCSLARLIRTRRGDPPESPLNGTVFSRAELDEALRALTRARTLKRRGRIPGVNPERADILVAGGILLQAVFSALGLRRMTVSEYALREGLLLDTLEKLRRRRFERVSDVRRRSVEALGAHCRWDEAHARRTARLALSLFDQSAALHGLGAWERELLEAAALLHDIGVFVSRDQHHRHAYYLIRHAEMLGYTDEEQEILANVARYHRKSHPKPGHDGFERLDGKGRGLVRALAGILRIADALDRSHTGAVRKVSLRVSGKRGRLVLSGKGLKAERWALRERKGLFEEAFGVRLSP